MNFLKRLFVLIGNLLPAPINKIFYKFSGVNFNLNKVWIGSNCFFDTKFPQNIYIEDNVCISFKVTLITHFDPSNSIKNHIIKKYNKEVRIKEGVFIGPGAIIYPGVTLDNNAFIKAGSVVQKNISNGSIVEGNPAKEIGLLKRKV